MTSARPPYPLTLLCFAANSPTAELLFGMSQTEKYRRVAESHSEYVSDLELSAHGRFLVIEGDNRVSLLSTMGAGGGVAISDGSDYQFSASERNLLLNGQDVRMAGDRLPHRETAFKLGCWWRCAVRWHFR